MKEAIWNFIHNNWLAVGTLALIILYWGIKKFFTQYMSNLANHIFHKRIETFKAELEEKRQEQQHFHELMLQTISQENKELISRRISAADHLWKSLIPYKRFTLAVHFLKSLNFDEIKKRARDEKIQTFLNSFPQCSYKSLIEEMNNVKEPAAELSRPWVSLKAWSLYSAYVMIIHYAIHQFESAKLGGELDKLFDKDKLLELIKNALPNLSIKEIYPTLLSEIITLIELNLLIELKNLVELKEDATAIERAKTNFALFTEIKSDIGLKDIK